MYFLKIKWSIYCIFRHIFYEELEDKNLESNIIKGSIYETLYAWVMLNNL